MKLNCQDFLKIRIEWKIDIIVINIWKYRKQGDSWLNVRFSDDVFHTRAHKEDLTAEGSGAV